MSNIKVSKDYNGKKGGTVYRGNTKATLYKVKGVAKPMLSEEVHEHILKIIGDNTMSAKDMEEKLGIGVKKVSVAMAKLYHEGKIQNKIIDGRMHYFKASRCLLQDIYHPLPNYVIKGSAKYTEKWFIKRLGVDLPEKKARSKRGEREMYRKYGD
jgi:hypothetical protein